MQHSGHMVQSFFKMNEWLKSILKRLFRAIGKVLLMEFR